MPVPLLFLFLVEQIKPIFHLSFTSFLSGFRLLRSSIAQVKRNKSTSLRSRRKKVAPGEVSEAN